jgi:hypothetical protein
VIAQVDTTTLAEIGTVARRTAQEEPGDDAALIEIDRRSPPSGASTPQSRSSAGRTACTPAATSSACTGPAVTTCGSA